MKQSSTNDIYSCLVDDDQVRLCRSWLRYNAKPSDSYCAISSHQLARKVGFWSGEYITNESLIEAARQIGYRVRFEGSSAFLMAVIL